MSSRVLKGVAVTFGVLGVVALFATSAPRWVGFLCFFLFMSLDLFVSLRDGAISSEFGPFGAWFHTYHRDEWPTLFMWCVMIQGLIAVGCLFAFLFSL